MHSLRAFRALSLALVTTLIAVPLSGCIPYVRNYVHLDAPAHDLEVCGQGAPTTAIFRHAGASIAVTLDAGRYREPNIAVYLDSEADVVIPRMHARVVPADGATAIHVPIELTGPPQTHGLSRYSVIAQTIVYRFRLLGLPSHLGSGTIEVPEIIIDGRAIPSRNIRFYKRTAIDAVPLNC